MINQFALQEALAEVKVSDLHPVVVSMIVSTMTGESEIHVRNLDNPAVAEYTLHTRGQKAPVPQVLNLNMVVATQIAVMAGAVQVIEAPRRSLFQKAGVGDFVLKAA